MWAVVGCSGWFYLHWRGIFYPSDVPQSKWFEYYASKFGTVELNSTFYRFPKASDAKRWYRASPESFVYTLKANRAITHTRKFSAVKRLVNDFYAVGDELRKKMGYFLFQLPPSIKFSGKKLNQIIDQLDLERKNAVEFRDESWFTAEVYKVFRENHVTFCVVSSPELPEEFVRTTDDVYIRFHGKQSRYASSYSDDELKEWAGKIGGSGAKQAWAYFNNDFNANAPRNALTLKRAMEGQTERGGTV